MNHHRISQIFIIKDQAQDRDRDPHINSVITSAECAGKGLEVTVVGPEYIPLSFQSLEAQLFKC